MIRWLRYLAIGCILLLGAFFLIDRFAPLPNPYRMNSVIILADNDTPLRAFADEKGVWRFPVKRDDVSPYYIEALLTYEDRWFYYHFGVNPLAMLRAAWQWVSTGKVVSGGSTLTMQVARILVPHDRSLWGKVQQVFRALQLEWYYNKDEILTIYLNLAPFGGAIEGVQTASYAYLHKPVKDISHAEAALLAVLPQAPSRLRPDRHPQRAQYYRDKVLKRLAKFEVWSQQTVEEALQETVVQSQFHQPFKAPLLSRRLLPIARAQGVSSLRSTISLDLQWSVESLLKSRMNRFSEHVSAAILVMENKTGFVRAYAGSVDFHNLSRFGHVDMVSATRSPGSTLKPFLYGYALDEGLIHSESLLMDVPLQRQSYRPENFMRDYQGIVSASKSLQQSLNVPAVSLLQHLGVETFSSKLQHAGVELILPSDVKHNLSLILGGVGTNLEDLVRGYSAFAREGISIEPRLVAQSPKLERQVMSQGAAWIIRRTLKEIAPPAGSSKRLGVAWKTGTSYGFRDAWALGVNNEYTVGVWVGRPDGTAIMGEYGAKAAAPLLFDVFNVLPRNTGIATQKRPSSVSQARICWPLGKLEKDTKPKYCQQVKTAWLLDNTIPPPLDQIARLQSYWINPQSGLRTMMNCHAQKREQKESLQWSASLHPWLSTQQLQSSRLPNWDESCPPNVHIKQSQPPQIKNLEPHVLIHKLNDQPLQWELQAQGGEGELTWLLNKQFKGRSQSNHPLSITIDHAGEYELMVMDEAGQVDKVQLTILNR